MNTIFEIDPDLKLKLLNLDKNQIDGRNSLSISIDEIQEMIPRFTQGNYSHLELSYFIGGLIELRYFNEAVNLVEHQVSLGQKYYAGVLADDLYDTGCPKQNDDLWLKYMSIAGEGGYQTFELNFSNWRGGENQCGLWMAGHHSSDYFIYSLFEEFVELDFHKSKIKPLVKQAYLEKVGKDLFFKDKSGVNFLPITTVFYPELETAIERKRDSN